jgi:hypothetical protein
LITASVKILNGCIAISPEIHIRSVHLTPNRWGLRAVAEQS